MLATALFASVIATPTFAKTEPKQDKKTSIATKKTLQKTNTQIVSKKTTKNKIIQSAQKQNDNKQVALYSNTNTNIKFIVFNYENGEILEQNLPEQTWPIASLTKLMTAYIFLENHPNLQSCSAQITNEDKDLIKNTNTRLSTNIIYSCEKLLEVMLISSDNYAASAIARSVPGWTKSDFISAMNKKVNDWKLHNTNFVDSSGLSPQNYSNVKDYSKIVMNIVKNKHISNVTSSIETVAISRNMQPALFRNSSMLVREHGYSANLSKTGHIKESGYNLVHLSNCSTPIGIVEFGARSSEQRASFAKQKLNTHGCFS
jgi:D-alanyl-D-alanine endopeptidase (penicillin-binding protein 7)